MTVNPGFYTEEHHFFTIDILRKRFQSLLFYEIQLITPVAGFFAYLIDVCVYYMTVIQERSEPGFVNVYGAQKRNRFRQPM